MIFSYGLYSLSLINCFLWFYRKNVSSYIFCHNGVGQKLQCFIQRESIVADLKQKFEDEKASLLTEQEKLRSDLSEDLSAKFTQEKSVFEDEIKSKLIEQHSEDVNNIQEQWKQKYAELKQKVCNRIQFCCYRPSVKIVIHCQSYV